MYSVCGTVDPVPNRKSAGKSAQDEIRGASEVLASPQRQILRCPRRPVRPHRHCFTPRSTTLAANSLAHGIRGRYRPPPASCSCGSVPPGWIENWQVGAWGEEATGKVLDRLDYLEVVRSSRRQDRLRKRGPHRGLARAGSSSSTRNGSGAGSAWRRAWSAFSGLTMRTCRTSSSGVSAVRRLAAQTSERVKTTTHIKQWVTPVMVVWAEFPQRVVEGDCVVVHGDELVAWLESRPAQIATVNVPRIAEAVRAAWAVDS